MKSEYIIYEREQCGKCGGRGKLEFSCADTTMGNAVIPCDMCNTTGYVERPVLFENVLLETLKRVRFDLLTYDLGEVSPRNQRLENLKVETKEERI